MIEIIYIYINENLRKKTYTNKFLYLCGMYLFKCIIKYIYISSHVTGIGAGATIPPFIHCCSTPASHMAMMKKKTLFDSKKQHKQHVYITNFILSILKIDLQ
jgi:hypothetical protein